MAKHYRTKSALVLVLLGLLNVSGWAADSQGLYVVHGHGRKTCTELLQGDGLLTIEAHAWVAGYVSSFNYWQPATYALIFKPEEVIIWFSNYCRLNPIQQLAQAAEAYVRLLYPTRQQEAPTVTLPPSPASRAPSPLGTKTKRY